MKLPQSIEKLDPKWKTAIVLTVGVSVFAGIGYLGYTYGKDFYLKVKAKREEKNNNIKTDDNAAD
jgi:hypothetical protein